VLQPGTIDRDCICRVRELRPDFLVVAAYGKILKKPFLDLFPRGSVNVHPSLLPRHRGPSPVASAILAGDEVTGVTIQRIALKVDEGDVLEQRQLALCGEETVAALTGRLGELGAEAVLSVLARIIDGSVTATPQDESRATYCGLIRKEDGLIDWARDAAYLSRMVRAYAGWPTAYTRFRGARLVVHAAVVVHGAEPPSSGHGPLRPGLVLGADPRYGILVATGKGILAVRRLQLQSKKPLDWRAFLNGYRDIIGTQLGG
jgi:methionyl-tRNA formyltransferase